MADAASVPSRSLHPDTDYQPLSGLAIAAILFAGLFAVILLGLVVIGFVSKRPIDEGWHLWMAVVGFVLAILARIQIGRSEGSRSGLGLATVAWWICLLGGGGFFAYLQANEYSLRLQSGRFLDAWFETLKKGDRPTAFLLTLEPEQRRDPTLNPADPMLDERLESEFAHLYPGFKNHQLVTLFLRNGADMTISQQGLKGWEYRTASTALDWTYRVSGPEGVALTSVSLLGTRPKGEKSLAWKIDTTTNFALRPENITTYGRVIGFELPNEVDRALNLWMSTTRTGYKSFAYTWILPLAEREAFFLKTHESLAKLSLANGAVLFPDDPNLFTLPPGFFRNAQGQPPTAEELEKFQRIWLGGEMRGVTGATPGRATIQLTETEIAIRYPVEFMTPAGDRMQGVLLAKLLDEKIRAQMIELRKEGLANPMARGDDRKAKLLSTLNEQSWQIIGLESNLKPIIVEKSGPPL